MVCHFFNITHNTVLILILKVSYENETSSYLLQNPLNTIEDDAKGKLMLQSVFFLNKTLINHNSKERPQKAKY